MGTLTITGGSLRSRRVPAPRGRAVRPTPARVKEALFSIVAPELAGARVLDLFAGTGALGLEALSRGAASVTFVEADRGIATRLRTAAHTLGVAERVQVLAATADRAATLVEGPYDLVFADPPYAQDPPVHAFATLRERGAVTGETTVVYEHSSRRPSPELPGFELERSARYGEVALAFYRAR